MNKFLKSMIMLVIFLMAFAALLQIFFPNYMSRNSEYGLSIGWQREIGFWNLAILPILFGILIKYDLFFLKIIVISLIIGGLGFGTNHLIGFVKDPTKTLSLIGAIENYLLVILWLIGLKIETRKKRRVNLE